MSAGEIDDPTLLGYLFGGLDDAEAERVETALRKSQPLRERLEALRGSLAVSAPADDVGLDPPPGLAERTLAAVRRGGSPMVEQRRLRRERTRAIGLAPPADSRLTVSRLNSTAYWFELSALAAAALVFGVIGLSHLLSLQEHARRQRCGANLAALGLAIQDYAFHRRDQSVPPIEAHGPLDFAGVYAVHLHDSELLGSFSQLWCPSDAQASGGWRCGALPTLRQLREAGAEQLAVWRRESGGSYTFNLGVQIDDRYQSSRYLSRGSFAVLGDAPSVRDGQLRFVSHGEGLTNVLFEDCSVRLLRRTRLDVGIDDPYLNDRGQMQPGVHADDAAMGPSPLRPRGDARPLELRLAR